MTASQDGLPDVLRQWGLAAQLVGIGITALGIVARRKGVGRAGIAGTIRRTLRRAWDWLCLLTRRLFRRPRHHSVSAHDVAVATDAIVGRTIIPAPAVNASVEERVARLERIADDLQVDRDALLARDDEERTERVRAVEAERDERIADVSGLRQEAHTLAAGSLRWEAVGVFVFVLGAVMVTVPDGAAMWLRRVT